MAITGVDRIIKGKTLEQLLEEETRQAIGLSKQVRLRLARWVGREDKDWEPSQRFMATYSVYANAVTKLLKAGIELDARSKAAIASMSTSELESAIQQILRSRDAIGEKV